MEFQIGQTYSGYEFLDILKRSRTGIEFRVRNIRAGRVECLRSLSESAKDDQERSERFLREMRVHASLLHPNIVTLFSAIELQDHLIMTTELVDGPTLADRLLLGPLSWTEAVTWIRQVLAALAYAHQEKIVHRDINPENIVMSAGGIVKLANFALAKAETSPKLTQVGFMIGNLKYISPEQIKGNAELDARTDLYAVGMVLYEMLCGRPAFNCPSLFELMAAQVVQTPVPPNQVNAAVPTEIATVVLKAIAKDPSGRYQTAADFDEALVQVCEELQFPQTHALAKAPAANGARPAIAAYPEVLPPVDRPKFQPLPTYAASSTTPVLAREPAIPAVLGVSGSVLPKPIAGLPAPAATEPSVPPRIVPDPAPSMALPAFLAAASGTALSKQQLTVGVAAGTCLGVMLVVLWLFAK
jgi:serine/threonine protein kinase